ncbi:hypothetical protein [Aquirufa nivalisilvae]
MTTKEHLKQRMIASAILERMQAEYDQDLIDLPTLENQRSIVKSYATANFEPEVIKQKPVEIPVDDLIEESITKEDENPLLAGIQNQISQLDQLKTKKINELRNMPRDICQVELVQEIKQLREDYLSKVDEYHYARVHGVAVQEIKEETIVTLDLPTDRLELNRKMLNIRTNLSKYRGYLKAAKTPAKKAHYTKLISQAEIQINLISSKIG